ncbi:hypothetical protein KQX54_000356 [Cotesia glomerata]|uniref:Uncharacterized protein n=1 Tax=Cotesia glomerata TaxID=32391 RepID=A0AAV7HR26_COTGL|nr:hypothetical protein KQX54_000356 [Cotesia glomerata]
MSKSMLVNYIHPSPQTAVLTGRKISMVRLFGSLSLHSRFPDTQLLARGRVKPGLRDLAFTLIKLLGRCVRGGGSTGLLTKLIPGGEGTDFAIGWSSYSPLPLCFGWAHPRGVSRFLRRSRAPGQKIFVLSRELRLSFQDALFDPRAHLCRRIVLPRRSLGGSSVKGRLAVVIKALFT